VASSASATAPFLELLPPNFVVEKAHNYLAISKHSPSTSRIGGNLDEYSTERWYDDKRRPRVVEIIIQQFTGQGIHFYVDMHESDNPLWCPEHECWGSPWRDPYRPPNWSEKFNTEKQARKFIRTTLLRHYGRKQEVRVLMKPFNGAEGCRWFYKEGD
jgi:hypothetical protein